MSFDQRQPGEDGLVRLLFQVNGGDGDHAESRAPDELPFIGDKFGNQDRFQPGIDKQIGKAVDDFPGIETACPLPGRIERQFLRLSGQARHKAGFADIAVP